MPLPTFDQFIEPILRHLAEHPGGLPAREVHEAAADRLGPTDSQWEDTIPSGQAVYKNRSGWANDRLKRDGLPSSPSRGSWCLPDKGVFLTTSSFSRDALEFSTNIERVVLVDGRRLAELMVEHVAGVNLNVTFARA